MDRDCKPANERLGFIREIPIADAAVGSVSSVSRAVDLAGTFLQNDRERLPRSLPSCLPLLGVIENVGVLPNEVGGGIGGDAAAACFELTSPFMSTLSSLLVSLATSPDDGLKSMLPSFENIRKVRKFEP